MEQQARIRSIIERNAKALALKPTLGHFTGVTRAKLIDGHCVEIEDGPWKLTADMPREGGGSDTAPSPLVLSRAALASCIVMGIVRWAARDSITIDSIEVEVQGDFDASGELGVGEGVAPGFNEVRYRAAIESSASAATLAKLLSSVERHSPLLDIFARPMEMKGTLVVNGSQVDS